MGFRCIFVDMVASTPAVSPAASTLPQTMKTYNLDVSDDEYILVLADVMVNTVAGAAAQTVNLLTNIGAQTQTIPMKTLNQTNAIQYGVQFAAVSRNGDTVTIQIAGGLTPDANTTIQTTSVLICGMSGTRSGT